MSLPITMAIMALLGAAAVLPASTVANLGSDAQPGDRAAPRDARAGSADTPTRSGAGGARGDGEHPGGTPAAAPTGSPPKQSTPDGAAAPTATQPGRTGQADRPGSERPAPAGTAGQPAAAMPPVAYATAAGSVVFGVEVDAAGRGERSGQLTPDQINTLGTLLGGSALRSEAGAHPASGSPCPSGTTEILVTERFAARRCASDPMPTFARVAELIRSATG